MGRSVAKVIPPVLVTERLSLRPVREGDGQAIFQIRSDPQVAALYGQEPYQSPEQATELLSKYFFDMEDGSAFMWAIDVRGEGKTIGECCIWNIERGDHHAELGYELLSSYWGKGLMREALTAIIEFGFRGLDLNRIEAFVQSTNAPSQRLLEKLGFKMEGTLRLRAMVFGEPVDEHAFGLLREEWVGRHD